MLSYRVTAAVSSIKLLWVPHVTPSTHNNKKLKLTENRYIREHVGNFDTQPVCHPGRPNIRDLLPRSSGNQQKRGGDGGRSRSYRRKQFSCDLCLVGAQPLQMSGKNRTGTWECVVQGRNMMSRK